MHKLEIKDLHVSVDGKEIIKGINLIIKEGEIHALMGPNGSGKTTMSLAIMGHPRYKIEKGSIVFNGKDITGMKTDERARLGLFLSFQNPSEIDGVTLANFLRTSFNNIYGNQTSIVEFHEKIKESMNNLKMDNSFSRRYLNFGFSGGEKKKSEMLQLAMLKPKIAVLDETDSGLDIDALKTVAEAIEGMAENKNNKTGILLITHYKRIFDYIQPDFIHILIDGKIVKSGGRELAENLEEHGYQWAKEEAQI